MNGFTYDSNVKRFKELAKYYLNKDTNITQAYQGYGGVPI